MLNGPVAFIELNYTVLMANYYKGDIEDLMIDNGNVECGFILKRFYCLSAFRL